MLSQSELLELIRPKGEWIELSCSDGKQCDKCGYVDYHYYEHNFCPNCGADMRGDDNGKQ